MTTTTEKVQIKSRWDHQSVIYETEVPADPLIATPMIFALEKATAVYASLRGADLREADLYGANLYGTYLREADLSGADLVNADLGTADLGGACLRGTFLSGASLRGASLCGADLRGADLSYVNLRGADLSGADLRGATLSGGLRLVGERPFLSIGPIGSAGRTMFAWVTDKGLRLETGCFFGTREEFVEQLADKHADNVHGQEYTAALALIDAHVRLWTPTN